MKRICFVTTQSFTINWHMISNIEKLSKDDYKVDIVCDGVEYLNLPYGMNVSVIEVTIKRKVSFFYDLLAFFKLLYIFRRNKYCSVHSIMPKSGILAMMASYFAKVPVRTHTFTGQVWASRSGLSRFILQLMDRVLCFCSTNILADSISQMDFLISTKIVRSDKISVLGSGSVCGVDIAKFEKNNKIAEDFRDSLGVNASDFLILFVGRITRDKGIDILLEVFSSIKRRHPNIKLCIVGPMEDDYQDKFNNYSLIYQNSFSYVGASANPEFYMWASDVLCLPSIREGFGTVVIEAAVAGLPTVGSNIYGLRDSIVDEVTGLLFTPRSCHEMEDKILQLYKDRAKRKLMSLAAHKRAISHFSREKVGNDFRNFYDKLLKN